MDSKRGKKAEFKDQKVPEFRLREVMEERKLTNVDLAKLIGYTPEAVSRMVNHEKDSGTLPALKTLKVIADKLGIPMWQFFINPKSLTETGDGKSFELFRDELIVNCPHCQKEVHIGLKVHK